MKRIFLILFLAAFLTSCGMIEGGKGEAGADGTEGVAGADGSDGTDGINGEDGEDGVEGGWSDEGTDTPLVNTYNLTGKLQKGPCPEGGEVLVQTISYTDMYQTGDHFIGFTRDNFGRYYIPAEIETDDPLEVFAEAFFKGDCHNELTAGYDYQEFSAIINIADEENNINPLTHVRSYVARWLFGDPLLVSIYGAPGSGTEENVAQSITLSEIKIIDFLQMPAPGKKFTEMNLENADIGDAILALFNSMVLYNGIDDPGDYMTRFSIAVIENNLDFKTQIQETFNLLPLLQIKNNIEARYLELGMDVPAPPIWQLGAPDYYAYLLENDQVVSGGFNLDDPSNCNFDLPYKRFAIPHIFESWIETSNYIAHNLDKNVSIWSRGVHGGGYDAPGIKLVDVDPLRENLLDSALPSHGMIAGHGLSAGDEVYFVTESETAFVLSTGCEGGLLPWGRKLASNDSGVTYIGWNNNTEYFRKSGLKLEGVN